MATFNPFHLKLKSGQDILFRTIDSADTDTFLEFIKRIPFDSTNTMQYVGQKYRTRDEEMERLAYAKSDKVILNVGAFDGNRLVGYLNFRMPNPDHPWVQHLAQFGMMVLKEYWGLGIGKQLLALQEIHAKSLGITRIEATVRAANDRGVKLYTNSGYKIEGTRRQAAKIEGVFFDEHHIAKLLNEDRLSWKPPTLETERLILRAIDVADAEHIFEYAKNPNVSKFTLWEPHTTIADSVSYIKDYVLGYYSHGVPEPFGIAYKSDPSKLIGTVGCFWISKPAKAMELACAVGQDHWGKGLMPEACKAIMDYCFKTFDLKRIQGRCKAENLPSAKVMQKIGMSYEGTLKSALFHRDRYWDMCYYAKVI
jgi:ribosomal-protein-alanine N-acetyltransferase